MKENFLKFFNQNFQFFLYLIFLFIPITCSDIKKDLEQALQDESLGNTTRALLKYEIILKNYPNDPTANKRMGWILSRHPVSMGSGIYHLEKALELNPEDEEVRLELFFLYLTTENFTLANKILEYYQFRNQESLYKELENLYLCEKESIKNSNTTLKILEQSVHIPNFWKSRCKDKLSKR